MIRPLKTGVRYILERFISLIDPRSFYCFNTKNLLILTYHRVLPQDHPDLKFEQPGMYVTPQTFRLHMEELKKRFELLHLSDWIEASKKKQSLNKYCCAVTFDDGWLDNYEYAYPIIKELEIPVTVFVVSSYLGTRYSFWPNRLSRLLGSLNEKQLSILINSKEGEWLKLLDLVTDDFIRNGLDIEKINQLIEHFKVYSENELNKYIDELESVFGGQVGSEAVDLMSQGQLEEMVQSGLVRVGSHTCHHKRLLDDLSKNEVDIEVRQSKNDLQAMLNTLIELFCYPNGNYTDYSLSVVKNNYAAACSTIKGWNTPRSDVMLLKRIGLHEDVSFNKHKFLAKISGIF